MSAGLVPCQGRAAQGLLRASLVGKHRLGLNVLKELGVGQIEHLDSLLGTDDEPVELLREEHAVDR